jgi:hypothetical protein
MDGGHLGGSMFASLDIKLVFVIAGVVLVVLSGLAAILKALKVKLPETAVTWQSFLRGQGTILVFFLLLGMGLGWISIRYLGVETSQTEAQIKLVEYRQLDLSGQLVYENLDSDGYGHVTVYAKSDAPQASTITVQLIPDKPAQISTQTEGTDSAWSRLECPISSKRLTLVVRNSGSSGKQATSADVLVFLSKK